MGRPDFTDQMGRQVAIPQNPQRIISLVPSITELLFDLGLGDRVVGVTRFCVHPDHARKHVRNIGGTKGPKLDRITELKPDLIIGSKEENRKEHIEMLSKYHAVWMSDVQTVTEGIDMIRQLGDVCGINEVARKLAYKIECGFTDLAANAPKKELRVAYLIWYDPIMVCGQRNFINDVLERCGWNNVFKDIEEYGNKRYPEISSVQMKAAEPEVILLSSEPYPFKEKHVELFRSMNPDCKVELVDGEMFSWYGSRMLKMPEYLQRLRDILES